MISAKISPHSNCIIFPDATCLHIFYIFGTFRFNFQRTQKSTDFSPFHFKLRTTKGICYRQPVTRFQNGRSNKTFKINEAARVVFENKIIASHENQITLEDILTSKLTNFLQLKYSQPDFLEMQMSHKTCKSSRVLLGNGTNSSALLEAKMICTPASTRNFCTDSEIVINMLTRSINFKNRSICLQLYTFNSFNLKCCSAFL